MTTLKVAPVGHDAARYACEHWHYSRCVPRGRTLRLGAWEDERFIGVVLFSHSANNAVGAPYGLQGQTQVCELTRVALTVHASHVSQIVSLGLRELKARNPGLRLAVSFADSEQGHRGGIYQAGNWIYAGRTSPADEYLVKGRRIHGKALRQTRSTHPLGGAPASNVLEWARLVLDPTATRVQGSSKYRYLMPLDNGMRRRILPLAQPYPPRVRSVDGDTSSLRLEEAGSTPAGRST